METVCGEDGVTEVEVVDVDPVAAWEVADLEDQEVEEGEASLVEDRISSTGSTTGGPNRKSYSLAVEEAAAEVVATAVAVVVVRVA